MGEKKFLPFKLNNLTLITSRNHLFLNEQTENWIYQSFCSFGRTWGSEMSAKFYIATGRLITRYVCMPYRTLSWYVHWRVGIKPWRLCLGQRWFGFCHHSSSEPNGGQWTCSIKRVTDWQFASVQCYTATNWWVGRHKIFLLTLERLNGHFDCLFPYTYAFFCFDWCYCVFDIYGWSF